MQQKNYLSPALFLSPFKSQGLAKPCFSLRLPLSKTRSWGAWLICLSSLLCLPCCSSFFDRQQEAAQNSLSATSEPPQQTILILYSPIGAGHISAATTIRDELVASPLKPQVLLKDIREFTKRLLGSKKLAEQIDRQSYFTVFNHFPSLYSKFFDKAMDASLWSQRLEEEPLDIDESELLAYLKNIGHHHHLTHVFATHYMGAKAMAALRARGDLAHPSFADLRLSWLNTDYFVGYFPRISQYLDKTFLAHKALEAIWVKRGVPPSRVVSSGLPQASISLPPLEPEAIDQLQQEAGYSLKERKLLTITIATGGAGLGEFDRMVMELSKAFRGSGLNLLIFAVPAANKANYQKLMSLKTTLPPDVTLKAYDGMLPKEKLSRLIQASDLYITKAGGLSPTEAFFINKPVVLLNLFGGHEKENAAFFEALDLALLANSYEELGAKTKDLLFNQSLRAKTLKAQKEFTSGFNHQIIVEELLTIYKRAQDSQAEKPKQIAAITSSAKEALQELDKAFPSELEILLSYSLNDEQQKTSNPFGHLAIRIGDTVYSTHAEADVRKQQPLVAAIPFSVYLYEIESQGIDFKQLANVEGQLWGRSILALRIPGFEPASLQKMVAKVYEINSHFLDGKSPYCHLKHNCAHHTLAILQAGGFEIAPLSKNRTTKILLPLEVFSYVRQLLKQHGRLAKYIFYQQIYQFDNFILPEFRYSLSRFPLATNLYHFVQWWLEDSVQAREDDLEMNTDLRLAYYPDGRFVFEDLRSYKHNDLVVAKQDHQHTEKRVVIPTFDDGPLSRNLWKKTAQACPSEADFLAPLERILEVLRARGQKGIFYVTAWKNIDLDPHCPTRNEKSLRALFQKGLKRIHAEDHIIALHAFDHELYRQPDFQLANMRQDILQLIAEIKASGQSSSPLWRTPYGSHELMQLALQEELGLTARQWQLDSFDYLAHDDSPLRPLFVNAKLNKLANQLGLSYSSYKAQADSRQPFFDILFHVNSQTAENLNQLLDDSQYYLELHQRADFSEQGPYYWLKDSDSPELRHYLSQSLEAS